MQINLLTQGLWEAMNGEGQVTEHDDTSTLSTFLCVIPPQVVHMLQG